jgi:hypothetical protein
MADVRQKIQDTNESWVLRARAKAILQALVLEYVNDKRGEATYAEFQRYLVSSLLRYHTNQLDRQAVKLVYNQTKTDQPWSETVAEVLELPKVLFYLSFVEGVSENVAQTVLDLKQQQRDMERQFNRVKKIILEEIQRQATTTTDELVQQITDSTTEEELLEAVKSLVQPQNYFQDSEEPDFVAKFRQQLMELSEKKRKLQDRVDKIVQKLSKENEHFQKIFNVNGWVHEGENLYRWGLHTFTKQVEENTYRRVWVNPIIIHPQPNHAGVKIINNNNRWLSDNVVTELPTTGLFGTAGTMRGSLKTTNTTSTGAGTPRSANRGRQQIGHRMCTRTASVTPRH